MAQIILNDDQLKAVHGATETIELRDQQGNLLGYVSRPPNGDVMAEAKRRSKSEGPWYTTKEVTEHLDSLEQG